MQRKISISLDDLIQQAKYLNQLPQLIELAIQSQVLLRSAENQGMIITKSDLQQSADRLRVKYNLLSAKDTLAWLKIQYFSLDDFEALAYFNLVRSRLMDEIINDQQIERLFVDQTLEYGRAVIYEVVFSSWELAMETYYGLLEHETDFLAVLHQYNPQPNSRSVRRQDLSPDCSAIVFACNPPALLSPIRLRKSVHLIYVASLIPAELTPELRIKIREEAFQDWLNDRAKEWEIEFPESLNQ